MSQLPGDLGRPDRGLHHPATTSIATEPARRSESSSARARRSPISRRTARAAPTPTRWSPRGDGTTGVASAAVTVVLRHRRALRAGRGHGHGRARRLGRHQLGAASDGSGSGVARYVVRRSLSSSAAGVGRRRRRTCQGPSTSCTDATTLNGKLYSYSVFAVDPVGNTSPGRRFVAVTARDQLAPVAAKGLAATPGDASVDLRWSAAGADDDVAGYVLVAKQGSRRPTSEADGTRVCTAIVAELDRVHRRPG